MYGEGGGRGCRGKGEVGEDVRGRGGGRGCTGKGVGEDVGERGGWERM